MEENNGICYICGENLTWDENDENCDFYDMEDDEGNIIKGIKCKHCGTTHQYYLNNECNVTGEDDYIHCNYQGFGYCAMCGGTIIWSNDFMRSDFEDKELDEDDDAIVRSLTCGHCRCNIEVYEPSENEKKSRQYPFWKDYNE